MIRKWNLELDSYEKPGLELNALYNPAEGPWHPIDDSQMR